MHVHEFMFRSIKGVTLSLERWTGQPILIVNTASESQFAPQLHKLQELNQEYMPSGLVILGVPCNEFGEKELDELLHTRVYFGSHFHHLMRPWL